MHPRDESMTSLPTRRAQRLRKGHQKTLIAEVLTLTTRVKWTENM